MGLHLESKKIEVSCNLDNVELLAEKALLERMIDNILSNAIKYNRVGGKIDIELNHEFLKIGDTGVGISKDEIELVFERYRRFNSSEGGFGIGLNIVYSIAKKYNYTVEIESEKSIGTKVWVRW
ncbi:MAG TPA: HAMP domain-containing histidine kinase [Nitratifractor sp.]|nr:HAMP domain-containing histidine kinase [Nitratifractor sp.]